MAELRKKSTLYDYDDYTANEMHAVFEPKVSTFFNRKWFHNKYNFIVRQLQVPVVLKPMDGFFYLDALDNKPKVGVMVYARTKAGYKVNIHENGKIVHGTLKDGRTLPKECHMMLDVSSMMKRLVLYRYSAYTPAKLYALFKKQGVPAKYDLAWFEEEYARIKKMKEDL